MQKVQLYGFSVYTMLLFYCQTNDALVAPLLRLKDNSCHVDESERILKKHQKYSELIILYEKKGLHRKGQFPCRHILSAQFSISRHPYHLCDYQVEILVWSELL